MNADSAESAVPISSKLKVLSLLYRNGVYFSPLIYAKIFILSSVLAIILYSFLKLCSQMFRIISYRYFEIAIFIE